MNVEDAVKNIEVALNIALKAGAYDINQVRAILPSLEVIKKELNTTDNNKDK